MQQSSSVASKMSGVSIITGGGSGIGAAIAKRLVSRSQPCIIIGRRLNKLEETKNASSNPSLIRNVVADVSNLDDHDIIVNSLKEGEKVKALIQNAGVLGPIGSLAKVTPEEWKNHMSTNLDGPLFLSQKLIPYLLPRNEEGKGGRILHVSSGAAHNPYRGWGAYCTSKAAFHMLYKSLSKELSPRGISVGSVKPGVVDTPMQDLIRDQNDLDFPDVGRFQQLKQSGNLTDPDDVATFIDWLLNETDDVEFSDEEWDIRNVDRERWINYL
jgi:NAD(P)-dependent dehydrogenase (short-subunit alcohol dehydrogenase family)